MKQIVRIIKNHKGYYFILTLFTIYIVYLFNCILDYSVALKPYPVLSRFVLITKIIVVLLLLSQIVKIIKGGCNLISVPTIKIIGKLTFLIILIAGIYLRFMIIQNVDIEPASDFATFYHIAELLAEDDFIKESNYYSGFIAKFPHTSGYAVFVLPLIFKIFGTSVKTALYVNLVYSILGAIFAYAIILVLGKRTLAIVTFAAMSLWPSNLLYSFLVSPEPLFTFLMLLGFYLLLLVLARDRSSLFIQHPVWSILILMLLAIVVSWTTYIRPVGLLMLIIVGIALMGIREEEVFDERLSSAQLILSHKWLCLVIFLGTFLVTSIALFYSIESKIEQVPVRGYKVYGYDLMVGSNLESYGLWNPEDAVFFEEAFEETKSASEAHSKAIQVAWERIKSDPVKIMKMNLDNKFRYLYQHDNFGAEWAALFLEEQGSLTTRIENNLEKWKSYSQFAYIVIAFIMLIFTYRQWKNPEKKFTIFMFSILIINIFSLIIEAQSIHHYFMIPFFIILASSTLAEKRYDLSYFEALDYIDLGWKDVPLPEKIKLDAGFDIYKAINNGNINVMVSPAYIEKKVNMEAGDFDMDKAIKDGYVILNVAREVEADTKANEDEGKL